MLQANVLGGMVVFLSISGLAAPLRFEREVVLHIAYGDADDEVGLYLPRIGREDGTAEGPDCLQVEGDSLLYISDPINRKVKCFRLEAGLLWASEGEVQCTGSMAVGSDGSVYVQSGSSNRNVTVLYRNGKLKAKPSFVHFSAAGVVPEWTPARIDSLVMDAQRAGLYEEGPRLRDDLGRVYRYERRKGQPFKAWFTTDDGSLEFEISVDVATLPDSLKGVESVDYWAVDGTGRLYGISRAQKPEPKVILVREGREPLLSHYDLLVLVYDSSGLLLGGVRQDYLPPVVANYYNVAKVMPNGNIYCYNYTAEGLEIVRYRPVEE